MSRPRRRESIWLTLLAVIVMLLSPVAVLMAGLILARAAGEAGAGHLESLASSAAKAPRVERMASPPDSSPLK